VTDGLVYLYDADVDGGAGLLAVIVHSHHRLGKPGTMFHTPPELPMQLGTVARDGGGVIAAHAHPPRDRRVSRTSETLIVRSGVVRLTVYRPDGLEFGEYRLWPGDVALLLRGGHRLEFLTAGEVLEVKQGPLLPDDKRLL
jgi:hypothetical protein